MPEATQKLEITMTDKRVVLFNRKQKLLKHSTIKDGTVVVQLDFVNGQTREFTVPDPMLTQFAAHGAEQKLGDVIAGEKDIEDAVLAVDDLMKRLFLGEWTVRREGGTFAGTSILIQALIEASGKTLDEVKDFLANKTQTEKLALRRSDKLRPLVEKLEAAKGSGSKSKVDTSAH